MKELILISLVALFIACQNQPLPESQIESPKEAVVAAVPWSPLAEALETDLCASESTETFDVMKELKNTENPGLHYRQPAVKSEITASQASQAELVCVSQVTSSEDEPTAQVPNLTTDASQEVSTTTAKELGWEILTDKWKIGSAILNSKDPQADSLNPTCQENSFLIEKGKLLSSRFEPNLIAL